MKYNILIVTSSYPAISGESFEGACVETFAQSLAHLGNKVTVLTQCVRKHYYKNSGSFLVRRFLWSKHVKPLSTLRIDSDFAKIGLYFFKGLHEADKIVREDKIDFIICAWAIPSGLFGLYLKKRFDIPYVVWALGSDIWNYSTSFFTRLILRRVLDNALSVYADGISLIDELHSLTPRKVDFLPTSRILPEVVSKQYTLEPDRIHFLFVGRYHKNKGPDLLIDAINILSPDLRAKSFFHFFGLGEMKEDLQSTISRYELNHCVKLNDSINNYKLAQYLKLADFIIIPSRIESIPVILSDALQKNCPIIATNVGDMGSLLSRFNIDFISQSADSVSMSEVLSKAILNNNVPKDDMKELYEMFDPNINARRFLKELELSKQ